MSTTTTYYTTYDDLRPYFADIGTLPSLSIQEEASLLSRLCLAQQGRLSPEQARSAKQRLTEGCLYRVIRIAKEQHPYFHRLSLADLVQEGNIGLLQAVEDFDFTNQQGNFFAYATACIRNAITRALPRDGLLSIQRWEFWRLAEQGRLKEWDRSQPLSLDMADDDEHSFHDVLPAIPARTAVATDAVRLLVETLLERLTPRERTVLRLFYGLEEADGRTLTRMEIAALLGLAPQTVRGALKRAVRKLRAAPKEPPPAREPRDKEAERQVRRASQGADLDQAYARLEVQGRAITMLTLAREAQVSSTTANAYLCQRWGTVPQRLERAYAQLAPTEVAITVERLAKAARVSERAASDFLHGQRGTARQARPRQKVVRQTA